MRLWKQESADELLSEFEEYMRLRGPEFFAPGCDITVARAPARIDCMGGIADYSGSVVFEGTLRPAAVAAYQPRQDRLLRVRSTVYEAQGVPCEVCLSLDDLRRPDGMIKELREARMVLSAHPDRSWAAYVLGALPVLESEGLCRFQRGANILLWSDIPIGVGVASSAAVEVASMCAIAWAHGLELPPERLAALAQVVENKVVGAPCGIMDQVTAALGQEGKLLALRCQPCDILGHHELPPGVRVFGLSSRVEHRVGGSAYATARVSAFMGLKIILTLKQARGEKPGPADMYLCNLTPEIYIRHYRSELPEEISGAEFLRLWGETTDTVTRINPEQVYRVRAGTDHPVFENYRVQKFIECLDRAHAGDRTALVEAGGLMYASHWSYSWNCGLGRPETDLIVRLVQERGPEAGFYGAKITGGGSGGTVAILADEGCAGTVRQIAAQYVERTGLKPDIFEDSSPGAYAFGARHYRLQEA